MSTNHIQPGHVVSLTACPYDVAAGQYVVQGALGGVAAAAALAAKPVDIACEGVFAIAKSSGSVFAAGQRVFFNTTDKKAHSNADDDSNSGGTVAIGVAVKAAGVGGTTVAVRLTQPVEAS